MQVQQIMTTSTASCRPDSNLAAVARLMWDHDCGFVPVVDASGKVAGVITDRDICIAAATRVSSICAHRGIVVAARRPRDWALH